MANSFMSAELGAIRARAAEIPGAYEQARILVVQADALRTHAEEAYAVAFEVAGGSLHKKFSAGVLTPLEVITGIAELNDLDPEIVALRRGKSGEQTIKNFEALQPDVPVLGLSGGDRTYTGIVTAPAEVAEVNIRKKSRNPNYWQPFMAPWGSIDVPLRTIVPEAKVREAKAKEVVVSLYISKLPSATIGRAAIESLVQESEFTSGSDNSTCHPGIVTNTVGLRVLRESIKQLHQLGMDAIDTGTLDDAIDKADGFHARQTRLQYVRRSRSGISLGTKLSISEQ